MANPEHLKILMQGVKAWNKWRTENPEIIPELGGANLLRADLRRANLGVASLVRAHLRGANLVVANLEGADLRGANLHGADLGGSDFTNARLSVTVFGDNDLSTVKGLETVQHIGPSTIGIDTIYKSKGNIPGAGADCRLLQSAIPKGLVL